MYDKFEYLWPPRPENALTADRISFYEQHGYVGQYKKNGTCSVFAINCPDQFISMTRHKEEHKQWVFSKYFHECFSKYLKQGLWYYFVGEVIHSKTTTIKDTVYIFDILVYEGKELYGETFDNRQKILQELFKVNEKEQAYSHYIIEDRFWLSKNIEKQIYQKFKEITDKTVDEGFVLKKKDSVLRECSSQKSNQGWQMKFRHPSKKYQF